MTRGRKNPTPDDDAEHCVLFDYGGRSVWMSEEAARNFAKRFNRRAGRTRAYLVKRKGRPTDAVDGL